MKKTSYLGEFIFLSLLPSALATGIMYLLIRATADWGGGYFWFFGIGIIGVPLFIVIYSAAAFIIKKKIGATFKGILRGLLYTALIIGLIFFVSMKQHEAKEIRIDQESADLKIMKEAIYTNNESLCESMSSLYAEVCRIAFQGSFQACQERFSKEKESSYKNFCIDRTLYINDDIENCPSFYRKDLCAITYNNKYMAFALIKKDKSFCQKLTLDHYITECEEKVDQLLDSDDKGLINSFEDGSRWMFSDLKYKNILFIEDKLDI